MSGLGETEACCTLSAFEIDAADGSFIVCPDRMIMVLDVVCIQVQAPSSYSCWHWCLLPQVLISQHFQCTPALYNSVLSEITLQADHTCISFSRSELHASPACCSVLQAVEVGAGQVPPCHRGRCALGVPSSAHAAVAALAAIGRSHGAWRRPAWRSFGGVQHGGGGGSKVCCASLTA
jgi:hypothetical protein